MYEDDFDIDDGLDLDQFDYKAEPVDSRYYSDDCDRDSRYHEDVDRYQTFDEHGYPRSRPYVAEFDDNIVFKSQPEYEMTPNEYARPFSTLPRSRAYRESSRSRKPDRDRYTSYEPRKVEHRSSRESVRSRPAYAATVSHYEPRRDEKYRSQRPSSHYANSDKYSMTRDWLFTEKFERSTTRKSKREKVRKFPPAEPNAPVIPPPDYDDDDTSGVLYVPNPDYS